jgi:hypothetical protein
MRESWIFGKRYRRVAAAGSLWAWEELNLRPHAYQAASHEHELGSEVLTNPRVPNILLSMSRFCEHLAHFREHFARLNGHHNGHPIRLARPS